MRQRISTLTDTRLVRGHDPAVTLSIYADAKADELRTVGASLFT